MGGASLPRRELPRRAAAARALALREQNEQAAAAPAAAANGEDLEEREQVREQQQQQQWQPRASRRVRTKPDRPGMVDPTQPGVSRAEKRCAPHGGLQLVIAIISTRIALCGLQSGRESEAR
jgi:hypothetical protein